MRLGKILKRIPYAVKDITLSQLIAPAFTNSS